MEEHQEKNWINIVQRLVKSHYCNNDFDMKQKYYWAVGQKVVEYSDTEIEQMPNIPVFPIIYHSPPNKHGNITVMVFGTIKGCLNMPMTFIYQETDFE